MGAENAKPFGEITPRCNFCTLFWLGSDWDSIPKNLK